MNEIHHAKIMLYYIEIHPRTSKYASIVLRRLATINHLDWWEDWSSIVLPEGGR